MDNQSGDKAPRPSGRESQLLPAILAVALAVASQLTVQDGRTLLGLVGYLAAAWLFVVSVRAFFSRPALDEPAHDEAAPAEAAGETAEAVDGVGKLRYLRRHWRLVTIAEIFAGDIPPARVRTLEESEAAADEPGDSLPAAPPVVTAKIESWTAADAATSIPKAVKVTAQGDVLVLDTGLEQVQRFDKQGNLLATYALSGFADVDVLDLDVSPDGHTLYIVDADSRRLRVISLVEKDSKE
jgi:hypothetical protein